MTAPYPADRAFPTEPGASAHPGFPPGGAPSANRSDEVAETSVGELIGNISNDLSQLFRKEVELAKAELRQEASKAGKAAGLLGGAGFAGYLAVVLLSFALVFALGNVMDLGWAALIVAVIWAIIGAVLYVNGRKKLKNVDPVPRRTVDTIKEDAQWLKNPTG
jgi:Putative Actinobacterial Holin-X, holin superfamily III